MVHISPNPRSETTVPSNDPSLPPAVSRCQYEHKTAGTCPAIEKEVLSVQSMASLLGFVPTKDDLKGMRIGKNERILLLKLFDRGGGEVYSFVKDMRIEKSTSNKVLEAALSLERKELLTTCLIDYSESIQYLSIRGRAKRRKLFVKRKAAKLTKRGVWVCQFLNTRKDINGKIRWNRQLLKNTPGTNALSSNS